MSKDRINMNVKHPWSGLGNQTPDAKTLNDVLSTTDLGFEVVSRTMYVDGNPVEGYVANVRKDTGKILGVVGKKYEIVQNEEAFGFLDGMAEDGMKFVAGGLASAGGRAWILGKLDSFNMMGDEIVPHVMFSNSYDGTSGIKLAVCMLRTWCTNGCSYIIPDANFCFTIKHTKTANNKFLEAQQSFKRIGKYQGAFTEKMDVLSQLALPDIDDFTSHLFPMPTEASNRIENNVSMQREALKGIYEYKDDIQKFRGSAYGAYMAVTDYVTHVEPLKLSKTFEEKRFFQIMEGAKLVESAQKYFESI